MENMIKGEIYYTYASPEGRADFAARVVRSNTLHIKIERRRSIITTWIPNTAPYLHAVIIFSFHFFILFVFWNTLSLCSWHSFTVQRNETRDSNYLLSKFLASPCLPACSYSISLFWLCHLNRCQSKCVCTTWKGRSFLFHIIIEIDIACLANETRKKKNDFHQSIFPVSHLFNIISVRNTKSFHSTTRNSFESFTFYNHGSKSVYIYIFWSTDVQKLNIPFFST